MRPPARYGAIDIDDHLVVNFGKQPRLNQRWISGGIFVCDPGVLDYIDGDRDHLEIEPVTRCRATNQFAAYRHHDRCTGCGACVGPTGERPTMLSAHQAAAKTYTCGRDRSAGAA